MSRDSPNGHDYGHQRHQRSIEHFTGSGIGVSIVSGVLGEKPNAPPAAFCHDGKRNQHRVQWGGQSRAVGPISEAELVQRGRAHSGEETWQPGTVSRGLEASKTFN